MFFLREEFLRYCVFPLYVFDSNRGLSNMSKHSISADEFERLVSAARLPNRVITKTRRLQILGSFSGPAQDIADLVLSIKLGKDRDPVMFQQHHEIVIDVLATAEAARRADRKRNR
jgi:hypothetical protein